MGQIISLFRNLTQRCRCSSEQQETESITMETVGDSKVPDPTFTDVSRIVLLSTDPSNTDTDVDLKLTYSDNTAINGVKLSDCEIEGLARDIESRKLESIAIANLGITVKTVNNLKVIRQNDYVAFNRDLLVLWRNKNPGTNQVQVSKTPRKILELDVTLHCK